MSDNHQILVIDDNASIHLDFRKVIGADSTRRSALDEAAADLFNEHQAVNVRRVYDIDSAYQGQEGLAMVQRACNQGRRYVLAFLDLRMPPGWDGIETARRLWEVDKDLQIVLCTAYSDYSWNDMVLQLGETDRLLVIKKPFDNIEVRQIACSLTAKWELAQQVQGYVAGLKQARDLAEEQLRARTQQFQEEAAKRLHAEAELARCQQRLSDLTQLAAASDQG